MNWVVYMHHPGRICGGSSPEVASPEVVNRHRKWKGDISPHFFPVFSALFSHRNFSRLYVRTMELWIQHVSGHYCDITPYSYAKPFFESIIYYCSYRNTCLNR